MDEVEFIGQSMLLHKGPLRLITNSLETTEIFYP